MISIVIPVKPPEPYLDTLKQQIRSVLHDTPHEILVQTEPGLGRAVERGVRRARGDVVVIMDADGSHDPLAIPSMLSMLLSADIVVGSRFVASGANRDTFVRRSITRVYNACTRRLLGSSLQDAMSGFIVAKRHVFDGYRFPSGYKFMLPLYAKAKHVVKEHPITFTQRKAGESKASFTTGIFTLFQLVNLYRRHHGAELRRWLSVPFIWGCSFIMFYIQYYLWAGLLGNDSVLVQLFSPIVENPLLCLIAAILFANFIIFRADLGSELKQLQYQR